MKIPSDITFSQPLVHLAAALWMVALDNTTFFRQVTTVYPLTMANAGFIASLALGLTAVLMALLTLIGWRRTTKPVLIVLLPLAAIIAYFSDHYTVVIDYTMIRNIVQTNPREVLDLVSVDLAGYFFVLGVMPALVVWRLRLTPTTWAKETLAKVKIVTLCVLTVFGLFSVSSSFFFSFFREHQSLRSYTNPTVSIRSVNISKKPTSTPTPRCRLSAPMPTPQPPIPIAI